MDIPSPHMFPGEKLTLWKIPLDKPLDILPGQVSVRIFIPIDIFPLKN